MGVGLMSVLAPRVSWAETCPNINLSVSPLVPRYQGTADTATNRYPVRARNLSPSWIDLKDCQDDIRLQFTLLMSGLPCSDTIQAWVGRETDCTPVAARQTHSGAARCWPVSAPSLAQESVTVDLRAQDLVAFMGSADAPSIYSQEGTSACSALASEATTSPCSGDSLSLYFMAIEADGETVDGTSAEYDFGATPTPGSASCHVSYVDGGVIDGGPIDGGPIDSGPIVEKGCAMGSGGAPDAGLAMGLGIVGLTVIRRRRGSASRGR
jgi:MYXO-CTERM domain-containing protein